MQFNSLRILIFLTAASVLLSQSTNKYNDILREFSSYRYSKAKIYRISNSQQYSEIFKFFQKDNEKLKKYDSDGSNSAVYTDGKYESIKVSIIEIVNSSDNPLFSEISLTDDAFKNLKTSVQNTASKSKDASVQAIGMKTDDELLRLFNYFIIKYNTPVTVSTFFLVTKNKAPQELDYDNDIYGFIRSEDAEEVKLPDNPGEIYSSANSKIYLTREGSLTDEDLGLVSNMAKTLKDNGFDVDGDNIAKKDGITVLGKDPNRNLHYLDLFKLLTFDIKQNNMTDVSFDAKGFGSKVRIFRPSVGSTSNVVKGFVPSDEDIQKYRMISEGLSPKARNTFNELTVSPDKLRWVKYSDAIGKVFVYNRSKIEEMKSTLFDTRDSAKVMDFFNSLGFSFYTDKATAQTHIKEVFNSIGIRLGEGQTLTALQNQLVKDTLVAGYGLSASNLPEIGIELKTGAENIGYPSFYTGQTSLSILWKNSQIGLILPTWGLSSIANESINAKPNFTYGSFGLDAKFDFAVPILPASEVFNFEGSYLFGDAKYSNLFNVRSEMFESPESYKINRKIDENFLRYTTALHYTFGFSIDEAYMFRVGVGASIYGVEKWNHQVSEIEVDNGGDEPEKVKVIKFSKVEAESIGGISVRLQFLSSNTSTPYGATIQYFDNNLYGNAWLQVGITNEFYLRFSASGFVTSLKSTKRSWEVDNYFVPNIRLIYYF